MSYHHGDLRKALIASGLELLAESGPDALSLREVARRAGVSHAAPYRHFQDRQNLLVAIAEEGFNLLSDRLDQVARRGDASAFQRLLDALATYIRFCSEHPHRVGLMFGPLAQTKPPSLEAAAMAAFRRLVELTDLAQREVQPHNRVAPHRIALALWAQTHGFALLSTHVDFRSLAPDSDSGTVFQESLEATAAALLRAS